MVNQIALFITEVKVTILIFPVQLLHHSLNGIKIHVNKQNAVAAGSIFTQFHNAAERNDPVCPKRGVIKKILHMRKGKMQILHLLHGRRKKVLFHHLSILLLR